MRGKGVQRFSLTNVSSCLRKSAFVEIGYSDEKNCKNDRNLNLSFGQIHGKKIAALSAEVMRMQKVMIITKQGQKEELIKLHPKNKYVIKTVVDISRGILAAGGEMHGDEEAVLLKDRSMQKDLWGASYYPKENNIEYISMINIRPEDNNYSQEISDPLVKESVRKIIIELLGP